MKHTNPEEGLIEGQNVEEDSVLMSIYMHEIYCKQWLDTLDTEEHHTGTEAVQP